MQIQWADVGCNTKWNYEAKGAAAGGRADGRSAVRGRRVKNVGPLQAVSRTTCPSELARDYKATQEAPLHWLFHEE